MGATSVAKAEATRASMLEAAKLVLREHGYSGFSTREVAVLAGVPLSQIHYHFSSKQGLIVALFQQQNVELLDRQERMFADPSLTLSEQWDRACDYLDEDLASGYIRVLMELWAAGWSDPVIAGVVRDAISGWSTLLNKTADRAATQYPALRGVMPVDLAALVGTMFIGAEVVLLLDAESRELPIRESLRRVGDVLRLLETEPG